MQPTFSEAYEAFSAQHGFSGTCLIRAGQRTLFSLAAGEAHRGFHIPNTMDTRFDTASVTKVFTAAAILRLVDAGRLRLTDRIHDYVDLSGTQISREVRLCHLLNHTSGIADDADEEAGEDYDALFRDHPNYAIRECRDFLPNFAYKPPNFAPGQGVRYNNCAFVLLGLAIESITGQPYRDHVAQEVFAPCGMTRTAFLAMDGIHENTAEGYTTRQDGSPCKNIYCYPPIGTPDGGAYTTVGDLDKFLRAIQTGALLSPARSQAFLQPHCERTRPAWGWAGSQGALLRTGYAFEFFEQDGKATCLFKEGYNSGTRGFLAYFPHKDCTLSLLANGDYPIGRLFDAWQQILLAS